MAKVHVTVFGFSQQHSGKRKVAVGSTVILVRDPYNSRDKEAIKVLTENEREQVGWVGNSTHMVSSGTKSASEVNGMFKEKCFGKIVADTKVTYQNGHSSDAYVVELQLNQDKKGESVMQKVTEFVVKIVGSKSQYPIRFERVIPDFKDGNTPYLKLLVKGDDIVAEYNGQPCGYVSKDKENGVSEYDDVFASIGDSIIAKVTKVVGTKIVAEFSVDEKEVANQKARLTLSSVVKDIVDQGITSQADIDEKIEYLKKNGASEKQILNVFKSYKKYDEETAKLIPQRPKTLYQDSIGIIKRSVGYINRGRNLMLEGDRGVGKNVMIETLAWVYHRPLFEFSLNSQHDNHSLLGGKTFDDSFEETVEESLNFFKKVAKVFKRGFGFKSWFSTEVKDEEAKEVMEVFKKFAGYLNGNTKMKFDPEVVVKAGEVGGFLVLDEFNTSVGHVMSILNSYLDDRKRLSVPGYKQIQADPNFIAFGTMNKDYQSTFELNEATSDRFVPIIFPKAKSIVETLIAKLPEVEFPVIQKCNLLYQGILKCVEDGEISDKAVTIRGFIDACLGTLEDIPLKDALIDNVANRCSDLDDRRAITNMIEDILG